MRKTIFTKSMKILIVSLLLLAVFFRKERSQNLMALAFILWAVVTVGILLFRQSGKLFKKCCALCSALKQKIGQMMESQEEIPSPFPVQEHPEEPVPPAKPSFPASDSREYKTMLLHIALRITEKLKSAYPQAVWQWKDTPSLQDILKGGTIRILVENMDTYTHADISFDRFGRIHVEPMVIGSFADTENGTNARPQPGGADEETNPEPSVVDVRVWYELIGQIGASPAARCWTLGTDYRLKCQRPLHAHHQGKRGYCRKLPEKENPEGNPRLLSGKDLLEGTGFHTGGKRTQRENLR